MNDLENYFYSNTGSLIHKWQHYFEIYDRYFHAFRNQEISVLEIGISHGGSLQMWKHYFGEKAKIYGVDINPDCKRLEEEGINIFIGSQEDRIFLESLKKEIPVVDILIDDGGHTMKQQICTFEVLYDHVRENGIYLIEDLHTSYWESHGGGYKKKGTFIEYSKNFIDYINAWHSQQENNLSVSSFTRSAYALHYYDSILVIEKRPVKKPYHLRKGNPSIEPFVPSDQTYQFFQKFLKKLKGKLK